MKLLNLMESPLKIMIVDDEQEAVDLLCFMLKKYNHLDVVATANNVDEAIRVYNQKKPSLILLDIQMPDKNGFKFIEEISDMGENPGIIFVTAYENYAIRALKSAAFDYILKPVHFDELYNSIERYIKKRESINRENLSELVSLINQPGKEKVRFNIRSGYILLNPREIVYCVADGNYTRIQLISKKEEVVAQNLGSIEKLLQKNGFFRISRSHLINLDYLAKVDRKSSACSLKFNNSEKLIKTPVQKIRQLETFFERD